MGPIVTMADAILKLSVGTVLDKPTLVRSLSMLRSDWILNRIICSGYSSLLSSSMIALNQLFQYPSA